MTPIIEFNNETIPHALKTLEANGAVVVITVPEEVPSQVEVRIANASPKDMTYAVLALIQAAAENIIDDDKSLFFSRVIQRTWMLQGLNKRT